MRIKNVCEEVGDARVNYQAPGLCANASAARNYGSHHASGDYVAYLDADDLWDEEHIENCVKVAEDTGADFVYGCARVGTETNSWPASCRELLKTEDPVNFLLSFEKNMAQTSSYFVRRECLLTVSWNENLTRHQDYDFFINMCDQFAIGYNKSRDYLYKTDSAVININNHLDSIKYFYNNYSSRMHFASALHYLLMIGKTSMYARSLSGMNFCVRRLVELPVLYASRTKDVN